MARRALDHGRGWLHLERAVVAISLVVPTYRRPRMVAGCLESVQHQTLSEFELLLVDNSPDGELRARIDEINDGARVPARYISEPRLGLHNARHAGARAASGDVLVFTDDDAVFDSGWLAAYACCFDAHPEMVAAGGPVRPEWEAPPPQWLCELIQADSRMFPAFSLLDVSADVQLAHDGIFVGVNMAIRREALFASGGFNPEIFGQRWLGDGETGLNRKLWARGGLIGYVPDAVVHHHVTPQRMTLGYLRQRQANDGACDMYARFHQQMPTWPGLLRAAAAVVADSARDWAAEPFFRGRTDPRALRVPLRRARGWGRLGAHPNPAQNLSDFVRASQEPIGAGDPHFVEETARHYRPLAVLSDALDYKLWGLDVPAGWQLTNLLVHLGVTLCVYALARTLGLARWAAMLAAAIFTLHPAIVGTEPAIARRHDTLSALFSMGSLVLLL